MSSAVILSAQKLYGRLAMSKWTIVGNSGNRRTLSRVLWSQYTGNLHVKVTFYVLYHNGCTPKEGLKPLCVKTSFMVVLRSGECSTELNIALLLVGPAGQSSGERAFPELQLLITALDTQLAAIKKKKYFNSGLLFIIFKYVIIIRWSKNIIGSFSVIILRASNSFKLIFKIY